MPLNSATSRRLLVIGLILFTLLTIFDAAIDVFEFTHDQVSPPDSNSGLKTFGLLINSSQLLFISIAWWLVFRRKKLESATIISLNEELERKASELEDSNRDLEAFCYSVSHDLRSHLARINGFAQLILEAHFSELSGVCQDYFNRVVSAGRQMDEVLEGLLTLSRLGRTPLEKTSVDLSDMVKVIMAEKLMAERERPVDYTIEPGLTASCDRRLMRIALENMLSNALKFTRQRDRARIEFGVLIREKKPVWFLRDNGAGFPLDAAERIFQPFQRVHNEAEFPGNGIGLATVFRIIKLHGGRIWAEGEVDRGACFYFTL